MAGTLTKLGIASVFFGMIVAVFVSTMVSLGNSPQYNVQVESTYDTTKYNGYIDTATGTAASYQELTEGAGIDQQTSDTAQLQEGISAEKSKLSFAGVLTSAINDVVEIFPVSSYITTALIWILVILGVSGIAYLLFGRVP